MLRLRPIPEPVDVPPRVVYIDIEARPLAPWYEDKTSWEPTIFAWKYEGEDDCRTLCLRQDGYWQDEASVRCPYEMAYLIFRSVLAAPNTIVTGHNVRRYDLPLFQGWCLRQGLPTLPAILVSDTLKDIPKRGPMSASLENLISTYSLPGSKQKMAQRDWERANQLWDEEAIEHARQRCITDVLYQEGVRAKLKEIGTLKPPRWWKP